MLIRLLVWLVVLAPVSGLACSDENGSCYPARGTVCCDDARNLFCRDSKGNKTEGPGNCKRGPSTSTSTTTTSTTTTTVRSSTSTSTSTTAPKPSTTTTTLPTPIAVVACRLNGIDASARWGKANAAVYVPRSSPNVRFASQQERDCLEQTRLEYDNQVSYTIGDLAPGCAACIDDLRTLAYTRIEMRTPYRGTTYAPRKAEWRHGPQGRLYQEPGQCVMDCRSEAMKSPRRAEIAARLASAPNLRNYLDVNDALTGPAAFPTYDVPKTDATKRATKFVIDTRKQFPPCGGGNGCKDLHLTHQAHACAAQRKIAALGQGPAPGSECSGIPVPSVAHVIYENGCGNDEECQWFRRIRLFDGYQDRKSWTVVQLAQIAKLQDDVHGPSCWMGAQARGQANESERCSGFHDLLHAMENDGNGWFAVAPWAGVDPDSYLQFQGNRVLSPPDLLALMVQVYGS